MKISKAAAGFLAFSLTAVSAFAGTLLPTWSISPTYAPLIKLAPYPRANNLTSQSATLHVYGYAFSGQGSNSKVQVADYDPSTGTPPQWTSSEGGVDTEAYLFPGDLDGDSTGAYVLFREVGYDNFLHLQFHSSSGFQWDDNYETDGSALNGGLGTTDVIPLFVRADVDYIYTGVREASGDTVIALWDKTSGDNVATCTLSSSYTVTSACLQRSDQLSGLSASFLLLAEYDSDGVGICKVTYSGTGTSLTANCSTNYQVNPSGISVGDVSSLTTVSGSVPLITDGIDTTGTYAYIVGYSNYLLEDYDHEYRNWGFNMSFDVSGTTPTYDTYITLVDCLHPNYESQGATICTEKCNGSFVANDFWAENVTWFTSDIGSFDHYSWFPDNGGTEEAQETALPYNVQQCAAYYDSSTPQSVAWYGGTDPVSLDGGIVEFTSSSSNPWGTGATKSTFTSSTGSLWDMEEGGSGEVYTSLSGDLYRFDIQ